MTASDNQVRRQPIPPEEAHVLIVEDSLESVAMTKRLLVHSGVPLANCILKTTGMGVVQFAETLTHLDLILLDLGLPDENGFEVLRQLRSRAEFSGTLVVAITGHIGLEDMRDAQDAGFDGFIGKPLDLNRFPNQLRRILKGEKVWENR